MKWTRGTCEFFAREMWPALRSGKVPLVEKLDVLFPALSLPLALVYFLFVIDANIVFAFLFTPAQPLTWNWAATPRSPGARPAPGVRGGAERTPPHHACSL
ncbi:MAG: hypothetical protein IPG75_16925 [Gemmatimonadetes bacterium]|nr:hypothetical protein [Gemmatimonadota bacterium]